jgi:hypothetical protein
VSTNKEKEKETEHVQTKYKTMKLNSVITEVLANSERPVTSDH